MVIVKFGYIDIASKLIRFLTQIAAIGLMGVTFISAVFYDEKNRFWHKVNQLLSNRLYYS